MSFNSKSNRNLLTRVDSNGVPRVVQRWYLFRGSVLDYLKKGLSLFSRPVVVYLFDGRDMILDLREILRVTQPDIPERLLDEQVIDDLLEVYALGNLFRPDPPPWD